MLSNGCADIRHETGKVGEVVEAHKTVRKDVLDIEEVAKVGAGAGCAGWTRTALDKWCVVRAEPCLLEGDRAMRRIGDSMTGESCWRNDPQCREHAEKHLRIH